MLFFASLCALPSAGSRPPLNSNLASSSEVAFPVKSEWPGIHIRVTLLDFPIVLRTSLQFRTAFDKATWGEGSDSGLTICEDINRFPPRGVFIHHLPRADQNGVEFSLQDLSVFIPVPQSDIPPPWHRKPRLQSLLRTLIRKPADICSE